MNLHEIFAKPVDRYIEGVIKADDLEKLKIEVEEYVITNEISKRMEIFFEAYNNYQGANGVWISGFFGSGKSHLLKMLAILLENQTLDGIPMLEMFQPKADSEFLKGAMAKAISIPAKSILFNIDQKAVTISKEEVDAVLLVFVKVFNEMQGYYGRLGYVAEFERHLVERGKFDAFKDAFRKIAEYSWEQGREQIVLESENVDLAYKQVEGGENSAVNGIIDKYRQDYQVSIEDFAHMVKDYIDQQEDNFRLNFFVDEVGQYVADHIKLMTNLQTIAESLATICKGQAFIIVTAQEEMETVMGQFVTAQRDDFTKIMDRFKTRMKLTSSNVDEVIKRRLLEKKSSAISKIEKIYEKEKNNFGTLFSFSEESDRYPKFKGKEDFVSLYPFVPYQFDLFQVALENLSRKNAFEGQHRSVGERSMLGVFQQVVIEIAGQEVGALATFDQMFEGIRTAVKAQTQRSILNAEDVLDPFAVKVLKALFLVKYVKEFQATPRNLRVLMRDRFDLDLPKRKELLQKTLDSLETQNFIQRQGNEYHYLTDEERDVQEDIKNTQVEQSAMTDEIADIVFNEVISHRKLRYEPTQQDFSFTKKIDDRVIGMEQELSIHIITPFNDNIDDPSVLQGYTMGKAEMMVVFPSDARLMADLYTYKRTEKFIRQNRTAQQDNIQRILADQSFQNQQRHQEIRGRIKDQLKESKIIVSGNEIDLGTGDPFSRIHKGFDRLIQITYPNLKMIQGIQYAETDIRKYLEFTKNGLFADQGGKIEEAEGEILSFVNRNKTGGLRTSIKKIVDQFDTKPYGWYLAVVQCLLAKLYGIGRIEFRADGNLLDDHDIERTLLNTRDYLNVIVSPQIDVNPEKYKKLKDFFGKYFAQPPESTDPRSLGRETKQNLNNLLQNLQQLILEKSRYPFLSSLDDIIKILEKVSKESYEYFYEGFLDQVDDFLNDKENIIKPIQDFLKGPNRQLYSDLLTYLDKQNSNFQYIQSDIPQELKAIKDDPGCYTGDHMRRAKTLLDELSSEVVVRLEEEKTRAGETIKDLNKQFKDSKNYGKLTKDQKKQLTKNFDKAIERVENEHLIPVVRDTARNFEEREYLQILEEMNRYSMDEEKPEDPKPIVPLRMLPDLEKNVILDNEENVDVHLNKLKEIIMKAIKEGKKVLF